MTVPKLRFREFDNNYKQTSFEKLKGFSIKSGKSNNKEESGEYPFYGSTGIIGYKSDYDYTGKAILIARVGANAGSLYQVDGKYSVSDNTLMLATSDTTDLDYVRELLVKFNLNRLVFGTGQPLVTGGLIKKVFISIPEVKEQTKIASFLSAVDDKISQLTQEHELLSEYKKGVMQQLFSRKLRFKADDGSDFEDWKLMKLKQLISSLDAGVSVKSEDTLPIENECSVLKTSCISLGYFNEDERKRVIKLEEVKRLREPVLDDSIIISRMNTPLLVGMNAYVSKAPKNTFLPDRLWQIKIKNNFILTRWLSLYLGSDQGLNKLRDLASGTSGSMKNITKPSVLNIELLVPSKLEQTKIANFLFSINEKIENVATQIDQAQVWKKGLLQQMFV